MMKDIPPVKIIDSTVILTVLKLTPYFQMDSSQARIKISTWFNIEFPEKINIVNDTVINVLLKDKNSIYVFDRGYYNYKLYNQLSNECIKFVTRVTPNAIFMEKRMI